MTSTWPPEYKLRKHKRARNVKFRVSVYNGLEITVPYRFNIKKIPALMVEHKNWIMQQLANLATRCIDTLPTKIEFKAIDEVWRVYYVSSDKNTSEMKNQSQRIQIITRPNNELILVGNVQNKKLCQQKLLIWIKKRAQSYLISQLEIISEHINLPYQSVTVRSQLTRWGSCNHHKKINLNYRLIFLPFHLVKHIIIHELCHTKFLNHSKSFWKLVEQHDPKWSQHRTELRIVDKYMPAWTYL